MPSMLSRPDRRGVLSRSPVEGTLSLVFNSASAQAFRPALAYQLGLKVEMFLGQHPVEGYLLKLRFRQIPSSLIYF